MARQQLSTALQSEVDRLDEELRDCGSPERSEKEKQYLKSELRHYGVRVPDMRRATKALLRRAGRLDHHEVVALIEELWRREVHELRMAAAEILVIEQAQLGVGDIRLLERLLRESRTWALVDTIAIEVVGPLLERERAELAPTLERWAGDADFWLRRSALLAHLLPIRRGDRRSLELFGGYAEPLLEDREFFIRKAIGWVLREGTKYLPDEVFAWLLPRAHKASGLTVREASKHLPAAQKEALQKARAG